MFARRTKARNETAIQPVYIPRTHSMIRVAYRRKERKILHLPTDLLYVSNCSLKIHMLVSRIREIATKAARANVDYSIFFTQLCIVIPKNCCSTLRVVQKTKLFFVIIILYTFFSLYQVFVYLRRKMLIDHLKTIYSTVMQKLYVFISKLTKTTAFL